FGNGKGVKIPASAYAVKGNRKKLTGAFSTVSPAVGIFEEKKPFEILVKTDDSRAVFSVIDNGVGIAPENLDKVFERFYRVDKARSREMGGNGLGLAIAAEIAKLHDGKISVISQFGEGTKFTVELKANLKK
ncbi:MAG: ATP-binding protein, partial [Selenomonadaceae bacterium]|nr:ATP-binding protein [Selenomonadaceae bacterium]